MHILLALLVSLSATAAPAVKPENPKSLYEIQVRDIEGRKVKLSRYKGKVLLIVNTASKCGFTPQYRGLQKIYEEFRGRGLVVLGFPSNDFGEQEPGSEKEIRAFCQKEFQVSFPLFSKVKIRGEEQSELYRFLQESGPGRQVGWNFHKFLVSRKGEVVRQFSSNQEPDSPELRLAIESLLR